MCFDTKSPGKCLELNLLKKALEDKTQGQNSSTLQATRYSYYKNVMKGKFLHDLTAAPQFKIFYIYNKKIYNEN
jgi:hypothetical protein